MAFANFAVTACGDSVAFGGSSPFFPRLKRRVAKDGCEQRELTEKFRIDGYHTLFLFEKPSASMQQPSKGSSPIATGGDTFIEFESLRGVAALLVVLSHVPPWNLQLYSVPFIRNAGLMVDLFFVLSGFIICTAYGHRLRSGRELTGFMAFRFARLYPLHLATLLFFAVVELLRQNSASIGIARANAGIYQDPTLAVFLEHLLMLQAVPPFHDVLTFNSPSWSIGVEFYTYLIFGTLVLWLGERARVVLMCITMCGAFVLTTELWPMSQWFMRGVTGFALGALVAYWWRGQSGPVARSGPWRAFKAGAPAWLSEVILVCIFAALAFSRLLPPNLPGLMIMVLTALFIASALKRRAGDVGPLARLMRTRPMQWLGTLSFTYYLLHGAMLLVMNNVARLLLKWPEALVAGSYKPQASLGLAIWWTLLTLVVMLLASYAVWRWYEVPAREAIRAWVQRRLALRRGVESAA